MNTKVNTCKHCGSDRLIPYTFKTPPEKNKGKHECTDACTTKGTMCLNCRMAW